MGRDIRVGYREGGRSSHIAFGMGKHFCVGYQLARYEAVIGSQMLLEAMGDPRIVEGQNPVMGEGMAMRSVKRLPLVFTGRRN
jgi:pulcherriminic acid synthase